MAEIAPFEGIRYDESAVGDLDEVVSPPYDIISPEDREYYHRLNPYNFVRLILGEEFPTDDESHNRFTRARDYLHDWLDRGILKKDQNPAIYVYRQEFWHHGHRSIRGLTCAVKLHDYADGVVLPHENTLARPKSQLGQLIRETRANLDSIYGLYADEKGILDGVMDNAMQSKPVGDAHDRDGVSHTLWMVDRPAEIRKVVDYLKDKQIAIADGHHRYETALAYRNEAREKAACSRADFGELPSDYTLMTLVNVYEKDMTVFPTHRVIGGLHEDVLHDLEGRLADLFDVRNSSRGNLLKDMESVRAIGMYRKSGAAVLKPGAESRSLLQGSDASRSLELNILHTLILDRLLGIDEDRLRNQTHIFYTRDPQEAMDLVDSGSRQVAFLLNEIEVKSVLEIASAGERMPQKATYFYPKLLSGLVLRKMD